MLAIYNVLVDLATFCCTCAEMAIYELSAKISTTPLDSANLIYYENRKF